VLADEWRTSDADRNLGARERDPGIRDRTAELRVLDSNRVLTFLEVLVVQRFFW
jgi:hypothetical protein